MNFDLSEADYQIIGVENEQAGSSVSSAGDVDGDGLDDFLIATAESDVDGNNSGRVYLVQASSLAGISDTTSLSTVSYIFQGENPEDYAGYSISSAGDVDGDGLDDILLEWQENDVDRLHHMSLFLGSSLGTTQEIDFSTADFIFNNFHFGSVLGDIDGDGQDEFILTDPYNDEYANNGGVSAIFSACPN